MTALYEIKDEILQLQNIEINGEDSLEEAIRNSLDELNMEFNDKVDNIVKFEQSLAGDIDLIDIEIKRLQTRKETLKNKKVSLRKYVVNSMKDLNLKTVKTTLFTVTSAKGRDKIVIDNEDKIPASYIYVKVVETPNKKALLNAINNGKKISGCHVEKSENSLRIK